MISPTVVLIHGATVNRRMWDVVRTKLEPTYRVVTPDLPGHGAKAQEPFGFEAATLLMAQTIAAQGTKPVVLVGESLGGYVAMACASQLPPNRLRGLIISGASSNLHGRNLVPYYVKIAAVRAMQAILGRERITRSVIAQVREKARAPFIEGMISEGLQLDTYAQAVRDLRRIDFKQHLARIEAPILFVNGTKDRGHCVGEAEFIAASRDASARHFIWVEHGVSLWRSAEFAELVAAFLKRLDAPDATPTAASSIA